MHHEFAVAYFNEPVDPIALDLPDYPDVITVGRGRSVREGSLSVCVCVFTSIAGGAGPADTQQLGRHLAHTRPRTA